MFTIVGVRNMAQGSLGSVSPIFIAQIDVGDEYERREEPAVFDTYEEAQAGISKLDRYRYYTRNGEIGRPEFYILKAKDADYVLSHDYEYNWDECNCTLGNNGEPCTECVICLMFMGNEREKSIKSLEYKPE